MIGTECSLTMAMKDFFGMKPGQNLKEFSEETKALTESDREDFQSQLSEAGYKIK